MSADVLMLTLIVPDTPVPVGEPLPVAFELRNLSERPVLAVGVLDGSESGIRYPHYLPKVRRDGRTVAEPPPPEDPLVSPLRRIDFRLLGPGEAFDPTRSDLGAAYLPLSTFSNFLPETPGLYDLVLEFSTASASPEQWLGRFGQEAEREAVLRSVAEVPRVTLTAAAAVRVR